MRAWFFAFFLVSGFCSLVYEIVWLRLAMAQFGVTTAMVSIVVSLFMAGLALGSWGTGLLSRRLAAAPAVVVIRLYAVAEIVIAVSGEVVPASFVFGRSLFAAGDAWAWGSVGYYVPSGAWVALTLAPFTLCMGATLPLAMCALRKIAPDDAPLAFSHLYVANLVGATVGTLLSAFVLIELLGFRGTLLVTSALNALLAAGALALSLAPASHAGAPRAVSTVARPDPDSRFGTGILWTLFGTGFAAMAMEIVWLRQFTPHLGNVVYAFATILATYLVATFCGSAVYRRRVRVRDRPAVLDATNWRWVGLLALLPLVATDDRLVLPAGFAFDVLRVCAGLGPFCAALGFTTALLVDRWSGGAADRAGSAYAVNVVGCIVGPLVSGFVLLPLVGERWALLLLALPMLLSGSWPGGGNRAAIRAWAAPALAILAMAATRTYESRFPDARVRRDSTATVVAIGSGMGKQLLVNGVGMTNLTPSTKMMAHLPLVSLQRPPGDALTICFGMGTSFRSLLSWGIRATAVELIPSVPALFDFFHSDGSALLRSPRASVVIDDGRRFLDRTSAAYDVIVIDPPPPLEAAGSSLLYSREFYASARRRLRPSGVLQQWTPLGEPRIIASFARTLRAAFPHVRAFGGLDGFGIHYLCSAEPIPNEGAAALAARTPETATRDMIEWGPAASAAEQLRLVLEREIPIDAVVTLDPRAAVVRDDLPINEYYLVRRALESVRARTAGSVSP